MKRVTIVLYEDAFLIAVASILDLLTTANQLLQREGNPPFFTISLAGTSDKKIQLELPAAFTCHKTLDEIEQTDLVIVPAFKADRDPLVVLDKNKAIIQWLQKMNHRGAEVASLCFACYFLAEAELLNGKTCTSHWMAIEGLQKRYPKLTVVPDAVMTDEDGIYTGGGGFSSLNLLSYIISKFCGREIAVQLSKIFSIDLDRMSQSHFFVFQGQRRHEDKEIHTAQTFIEKNCRNNISVNNAFQITNMSKRNFIRRFKKATHYTPMEYIRRVKIEAAKKDFETSQKNINEVMYGIGYSDTKAFRSVFKKYTGLNPIEYKNKYRTAI